MPITLVEANPDAGFNYPYYLAVPESIDAGRRVPILVEPTNVGRPTDDFDRIRETAERKADGGFGRRIAEELSVPLLHPVFPRPVSDPVDWTHFTHSLDVETLSIEEGPLARIDLQLLEMVSDATDRLSERGIAVEEQFSMNGFSAAGTFVNRFAALHPERLLSVTAGGINGMAILPIADVDADSMGDGRDLSELAAGDRFPLEYHLGVGDLEELTGTPFDADAFRSVNQFLYMGEEDTSDALLYPDAWTGPELRGAAVLTYGEDVHDERFPTCKAMYEEAGASAVFRTYPNTGHTPEPALDDLVTFHERSIAGDDVAEIRADLGGNVPG